MSALIQDIHAFCCLFSSFFAIYGLITRTDLCLPHMDAHSRPQTRPGQLAHPIPMRSGFSTNCRQNSAPGVHLWHSEAMSRV